MSSDKIGSILKEEHRKQLADLNFKPGNLFKLFCTVAKKEKYLIFIGFHVNGFKAAFVHINSEINPNVFHSEKLKSEHLLAAQADYPFLAYDSFVNCSRLIIRPKAEIYQKVIENPGLHICKLKEDFFEIIKRQLCMSRLLTSSEKKEYGLFFLCR